MGFLRWMAVCANVSAGIVLASGCGGGSLREPSDIADSAERARPLDVPAPLPAVTLKQANESVTDLRSLAAGRPTVVIFYRGGWCPYCNTHLSDLRNAESPLKAMGFQILAISPDKPENVAESVGRHHPGYTLLSDSGMEAARRFGVAFHVDGATLEKYRGFGIDLEKASGETHHLLPVPSVFIADADGIIRYRHSDPDYKVRISASELVEAARSVSGE